MDLQAYSPYILDIDKESLAAYSHSVSGERDLNAESIPEPFIGHPENARVVLLGLNPGHSDKDKAAHENEEFKSALFRNLRHEWQKYPFYPLNPEFSNTPTAQWWRSHLRALLEVGLDSEIISQKLMVIEWFPYHSKKSGLPIKQICPSQQYSFELARKMLETRLVIRMRSKAHWEQVDPRLGEIHCLSSPQNCCISRRNLGEEIFETLIETLRK